MIIFTVHKFIALGTIVFLVMMVKNLHLPAIVSSMHSLFPYMTMLSTAITLFLLLSPKTQELGF